MKRILLATLFFLTFSATSWAGQTPSIFINGNLLSLQNAPVIEKDRVMVPLREIFEALNHQVLWNMADQSISTDGIWLQIGNPVAKVKDRDVTLDAPAEIIDDKTYIPLRFIAESLGKKVTWNSSVNRVDINDDAYLAKLKFSKDLIDTNAGLYQNIIDETLSLWKSSYEDRTYDSSGFYIDKKVTSIEYGSIFANLDKRDQVISASMDALDHPDPDDMKAYTALKEYYNAYVDCKKLAISPEGTFDSYNASASNIKSHLNIAKSNLESLIN